MAKLIPMGCLVVLVGPSGAGKSTFAHHNFDTGEIISSDDIRQELFGDFTRQDQPEVIFAEFRRRIEWRLQHGYRAVADATHLRDSDRAETAMIGFMLNVPIVYVVVNRSIPAKNASAGWRPDWLIEKHDVTFRANEGKILTGDTGNKKGFRVSMVVDTRVDAFEVAKPLTRVPRDVIPVLIERGYDRIRVIGDVHGNMSGLINVTTKGSGKPFFLFLGDVVDYGVDTLRTLDKVHEIVMAGRGGNINANHEAKIGKWVKWYTGTQEEPYGGKLSHGNDVTVNQLLALNPAERNTWIKKFRQLVEASPDFLRIDTEAGAGGIYGFAHGAAVVGMYERPQFRYSDRRLWELAMFGETVKNETMIGHDGNIYPKRSYNWVDDLPARYTSIVGHAILDMNAPVVKTNANGGTAIFLDTGSSKGGKLSYMDLIFRQEKKHYRFDIEYGDEHSA